MKNIINKIILFAAVAAGLSNISANAQQATFQVYLEGANIEFSEPDGSSAGNVNFVSTNTVLQILMQIVGLPAPYMNNILESVRVFRRLDSNYMNETPAQNFSSVDNNLQFGSGTVDPMMAGDIVRIFDAAPDNIAHRRFDMTTRVYTREGALRFAFGERPVVRKSSLLASEFFIRKEGDSYTRTTTPHTLNIGYVAPSCTGTTPHLSEDGLSCSATPPTTTPPPPQNTGVGGYWIFDNNGTAVHHTSTGYPDAASAEAAATQICIDSGETRDACDGFSRGSFGDGVFAWNGILRGVGADNTAAVMQMLQNCVRDIPILLSTAECRNVYPASNDMFCGDGTAEDLTDDCGDRMPPPLTCTGDATMNTAGTECECNVAASPFLQDDGGNSFSCRAPNSTDECTSIDRNTGFYDTGSASCRMPTGTPGENSFDCTEIADAVDRANGVQNMTVDRRYIFDTSAPGLCRTPKSALECGFAGLNSYYDSVNDICRAPMTDAECRENLGNRTPFINDAGMNCRTANSPEECEEAYPVDGLNLPIHDTTAFGNCRIAQSAADCPGEFFNAVSPARCEPIRTCGTGTTGTVTQNQCECAEEGDLFVLGSNMQMCETPVAATCGANAINSPDDIRLCICENTETHQFVAGSTTACEPIPATCGANAINDPNDNTMCICENTQTHQFVAGSTTACEPIPANPNTPTCEEHQMLNSSNECVNRTAENCGNGEVFSPVNSGGICQTPEIFFAANTITVAAEYSAESCESAGWISSIAINNEKTAAAELCGIPVVRDDSVTATAAAANAETAAAETAAAESVPLQFPENENANGCIIRESADFLTLPDCNDSQLFGNGGFPQMPESFDIANDRLTVAFVADGENQIFFNGEEIKVSDSGTQSPTTDPTPTTGGGGNLIVASDGIDYTQFGGVVGGVVAVYIGINYISGNFAADDFSFSPDFGYRITESGYSANAGGRMDLRKDELHLYSIAKQTNANGEFGDFRYTTGGKYTADFWTATFSESLQGETVNYDFSLSANLQSGIWNISPIYRMHSRFDKDETETRNSLNLQSEFRYNRWTINPSAGFRWENENNFSENARFQINAVHRF